jgi:hypothetical protein
MEFYATVFSSNGPCPLKNLEPPLKKIKVLLRTTANQEWTFLP